MKKMQCEVCGSTDIKKIDDSTFECQSCGVQYSKDEVQKLLVEITGSVKIDRSEEIENAFKRAETFEQETCAACGITSGSANGHDMCITRCTQCDYTDFSKIARTYTEIHSYDFTTGIRYDVQNVIINSDGILSFCFNGNNYSVKLVQTTKYLPSYEYMAKFDCYVNGNKVSDAEFEIDKEYYIPRLTWKNLDGCNFYFYAE